MNEISHILGTTRNHLHRNKTFSVMIADPEQLVCEGIKQLLSTHHYLQVIHEAQDFTQVQAFLQDQRPDVLILEIGIARHGGVHVVRELIQSHPDLHILVMSDRCERSFALRAFRAGASGFVNKEYASEELAEAVLTVACGRPYVSETVRELLAESVAGGHARRLHDQLSDTDFDIFCLIANGIPISKVATICHVTPAAIRSRRNKMMQKMLLRTDAEIVAYAIENNLIEQGTFSRMKH